MTIGTLGRGTLCANPFHVFQMGIIFEFDVCDTFLPGDKISFSNIDFIAYQFKNLQLQDPEPAVQVKEPPSIYIFLIGL